MSQQPSDAATPSPFSRIDHLTARDATPPPTAAAAASIPTSPKNNAVAKSNSNINNDGVDYAQFWASQTQWKKDTLASPYTVIVKDPQLQPRTWSNPNPPIMFLILVNELTGSQGGVRRRYSDFEYLRNILISRYCGILVPPLPEKKMMGNKESEFLRNRMRRLGFFLERLVSNPYLRMDPATNAFLTMGDQGAWTDYRRANPPPASSIADGNTNNSSSTSATTAAAAASIASAASNSLASVTSSASTFFSSLATTARIGGAAAPTQTSTTESSDASAAAHQPDTSSLQSQFKVSINVDRNATDPENRWKACIVTFSLPANFEKLITDVRMQLDSLETVMQALVASSSKILESSNAYAWSLRHFNSQYENVMKVETSAVTSLSSGGNSAGQASSSENKANPTLSNVLQGLGVAFGKWSKLSDTDPTVIEQLLHEVLGYEYLCIKELKRMLAQRDAIIGARDKVIKSQRAFEVEKEGYDKTGKADRSARAQVRIMECKTNTQHYDLILDMMNKGLFLDTLENFTASKIHMFKDLIGKLAAAKVRQAQEQQVAWMNSIADLQIDFEQASAKASATLEAALKSADQRSEDASEQQQQGSSSGPLLV